MEIYTLDSNFLKKDVIDDFTSFIWTERYSSPGDVTMTLPSYSSSVAKLAEGTFLAISDSKEVMQLETQDFTDSEGNLKVTGRSLLGFLEVRLVRNTPSHGIKAWVLDSMSPGEAIGYIVQQMCTPDSDYTVIVWTGLDIDYSKQIITNLEMGDIDATRPDVLLSVPFGPVLEGIQPIADTYKLGMSLYLDSADASDYVLKFKVYDGVDRTSDQDDVEVVRFSPAMDSLSNVKEFRSMSGYRNVAYAFASAAPEGSVIYPGIAYADADAEDSTDFDRRNLMIFCDDVTLELAGNDAPTFTTLLNKRAQDALINNNYVRLVDGEIVPQAKYQYGVHYNLGDVIELQGHSDAVQKARVTEYIRSQDATGLRTYPTISSDSIESPISP